MKEYKGWELIKMANEGKIKDGDEFSSDCLYVKFRRTNTNGSFRNKSGEEVGNSYFTKEHIYTKVRKKLTFLEAMKMVDEGLEVTNDLVEKYKGTYKKIDGEFKYLEDGEIKNDIEIFSSEFKNNWYVYQ